MSGSHTYASLPQPPKYVPKTTSQVILPASSTSEATTSTKFVPLASDSGHYTPMAPIVKTVGQPRQPTSSPTPSQLSNDSNSGNGNILNLVSVTETAFHFLAKGVSRNFLPYNVTPPRPPGVRTEAERKVEELTRQIEEEMERNEEQGEYFGISNNIFKFL